ncbi:MAG: hypothetical protein AAF211_16720, partial [Myxococcota bacterium]
MRWSPSLCANDSTIPRSTLVWRSSTPDTVSEALARHPHWHGQEVGDGRRSEHGMGTRHQQA